MDKIILFVFEGERAEGNVFQYLIEPLFCSDPLEQNKRIRTIFCADIYQLWQQWNQDRNLDLVRLLMERSVRNKSSLDGVRQRDISQVFLFFDYDGHATGADNEKINELLEIFCEETESGKLYLSYPMVEAIKEPLRPAFESHAFPIFKSSQYKQSLEVSPFQNMSKITSEQWRNICEAHLRKGLSLGSGGVGSMPDQETIFRCQLGDYIQPRGEVLTFSGFPFFLHEYFGHLPFSRSK